MLSFCGVFLWRCRFSIGILGQMWCLIYLYLIFAHFLTLKTKNRINYVTPGVLWMDLFCDFSSRCRVDVDLSFLWYFPIILTYIFNGQSKYQILPFTSLVFPIGTWRVSIADSCTFHLNLTCQNEADRWPITGRGLHSHKYTTADRFIAI